MLSDFSMGKICFAVSFLLQSQKNLFFWNSVAVLELALIDLANLEQIDCSAFDLFSLLNKMKTNTIDSHLPLHFLTVLPIQLKDFLDTQKMQANLKIFFHEMDIVKTL